MTIVIDRWTHEKKALVKAYKSSIASYKNMKINKGDIYFCKIGENIGDETCKERPVIVLSKTFYNNATTQITIAPLSTTIKTKEKDGKIIPSIRTHFILKQTDYAFLTADSAVMCEQIRSISKVRLIHKLGEVQEDTLKKINARVKDLFDI